MLLICRGHAWGRGGTHDHMCVWGARGGHPCQLCMPYFVRLYSIDLAPIVKLDGEEEHGGGSSFTVSGEGGGDGSGRGA